jgi:hypothetical protein
MIKESLNIVDNILKLREEQQYRLFIFTTLKDIGKESPIEKV